MKKSCHSEPCTYTFPHAWLDAKRPQHRMHYISFHYSFREPTSAIRQLQHSVAQVPVYNHCCVSVCVCVCVSVPHVMSFAQICSRRRKNINAIKWANVLLDRLDLDVAIILKWMLPEKPIYIQLDFGNCCKMSIKRIYAWLVLHVYWFVRVTIWLDYLNGNRCDT